MMHPFNIEPQTFRARPTLRLLLVSLLALGLSACSSLGASGPGTGSIRNADLSDYDSGSVQIVELDGPVVDQIAQFRRSSSFSEMFGDVAAGDPAIGHGDVLDIVIWEAPPAVLFGATQSEFSPASSGLQGAQSASIPQQMVGEDGTVTVPFVGQVPAVGRQTRDIERDITSALQGRAHDPQVIVRLARNEARTVTVLGEVAGSTRMPLTARGERLLDALASAGGTRQPVDRSIIQLTRQDAVSAMPLLGVINDPTQNVRLHPDDVVTVLHQPFSFVALGAVSRSAEIPFDGAGLSLAQALGRAGGLNNNRADVRGVFIFRLEHPNAVADGGVAFTRSATADGRFPVIYSLDMSDPASLFAMQNFAINDDDVLYVSTAPGADLQRFVSTISAAAFSVIGITNALQSSNN